MSGECCLASPWTNTRELEEPFSQQGVVSTVSNLPSRNAFLIWHRAAFSDLASTTKSAKQLMSWAYEQTNLGMGSTLSGWIFGAAEHLVQFEHSDEGEHDHNGRERMDQQYHDTDQSGPEQEDFEQ
jgi:hypothetical protein